MAAPAGPSFARVSADYQKYLGRPLSQADYYQYWAYKPDYATEDVANSPEAQARVAANPGDTRDVGANIPWDATKNRPSYDPPGYHWDEFQSMFVANAATTPPPAGSTGGGTTGGSTGGTDVRAFIAQLAAMPGADPSLTSDPDYWINAINSRGGLTDANRQYWQDAAVGPTAFFNNPNREQGGSASGTSGAAPTFTAPAYEKPPAFSYADFVAPDPSQLASDPWTQYTLKTQQDAIQKSAAARGTLQTGGTINDLLTNASAINAQGYQNLWNNAQQTYATNRGNAVDAYNTNYGTQYSDPYHYQYQGAQDTYNAAAHAYDQGQLYDWNKTLFGEQQSQDTWANKFKLLGLI